MNNKQRTKISRTNVENFELVSVSVYGSQENQGRQKSVLSLFIIHLIWSYIPPIPYVFNDISWWMRRQHRGGWSTRWCIYIT